jgi:hypothetical protein
MPLSEPVRLDPYQRIVNVGWSGVDILVLEFNYRRNGPRPAFTLRDLPFTSTTYDLFDSVIVNNDGAGNPAPGNPITNDMLKFLRLWNRLPYFRSIEGSNRGRAILFFNLRKIRVSLPQGASTFTFKIATPASSPITTSGGEYWCWSNAFGAGSLEENEENPFTTGDPRFPPFGVITIPTAFATAGEASAFAALFIAPEMFVTSRVVSHTQPDGLGWDLRASSYRNKTNFPTAPDNSPDWDLDEAIDGTEQSASSSSESAIPAYLVTVQVDTRTLAVASSKA